MKWESSDLMVGAVVVAAALILLGSFVWLSPALAGRTYPIYTEFDRIDGIGSQANVVLRGFTIGSVGGIEPRMDGQGGLRFRVRLDLRSRLASGDSLRLPVGTIARLMPPPVIGAGFIILEPPRGGGPPLEPGAQIQGVRTTAIVEQMQDITTDLTGDMLETMGTARALMDSVTMSLIFANQAMAHTVAAIPPLVEGLQLQLASAHALTEDLRSHLAELSPAAVASIDSATLLLSDSRRLVADLNALMNSTAPEIGEILANLDTTTILLTHFVREVTARPWRAFTGVRPPEGLVPPPPGPAVSAGSQGDTVPRRP